MGRWAQRRRNGGGPQTVKYMVEATITSATTSEVRYNLPVVPSDFGIASFGSTPSGEIESSLAQVNATTIEITWGGPVTGDVNVEYTGTNFGFAQGQVLDYT